MRRESGRSQNGEKNYNLFYIGGSILALGIIAFVITFVVYGNKMDRQADLDSQKIAALMKQSATETEEASTQMGKTVEESKNEMSNNVNSNTVNEIAVENKENKNTTTNKVETKNNVKVNTTSVKKDTTTTKKEENTEAKTQKNEETKKEVLTFIKPVEGEIAKDYAKDKLLYSETLEEWTTHLGWDIKADKTSVVKASASGKIKSIKNDPRYGLSIIIEHQDGYQTLYANLLSTEFVQVGEEVKQGQSIGTVGNTAAFEIADETHLHFEITKNGENVDPNTLIK